MSLPIIFSALAGMMPSKTAEDTALDELQSVLLTPDGLNTPLLQSFERSLQGSMGLTQSENEPDSSWFAPLQPQVPIQFETPLMPLGMQSGKTVPHGSDVTGSTLPLLGEALSQKGQQPSLLQPGLQGPAETADMQSESMLAKLLPKNESAGLGALSVTPDPLLHRIDSRGVGDVVEQYSMINSQTVTNTLSTRVTVPILQVNVPVGQPNWDKAMGERIQWMLGKNIQHAEVKLTPPNLGPLEVRISLQNDQASVSFMAAQAPTREALEAAIPRLREMFGEASLNLASVDVGHRESSGHSQEQTEESSSPGYHTSTGVDGLADHSDVSVAKLSSNGIVDDYA